MSLSSLSSLSSSLLDAWQPRPRFLYCIFSVWFGVLANGFVTPFLQQQANLSDGRVGTALAAQGLVTAASGSVGSQLADAYESSWPGVGRIRVVHGGIVLGTLLVCAHGMPQIKSVALGIRPVGTKTTARLPFTYLQYS